MIEKLETLGKGVMVMETDMEMGMEKEIETEMEKEMEKEKESTACQVRRSRHSLAFHLPSSEPELQLWLQLQSWLHSESVCPPWSNRVLW